MKLFLKSEKYLKDKKLLKEKGFDICHPFNVKWYNKEVKQHNLPTFNREICCALLIGNTKHFWNIFIDYLKKNKEFINEANPLERYVEQSINEIMKGSNVDYSIHYSHHIGNKLIAFQKLTHFSGFAFLSNECKKFIE
jgi:hypothetical protein